jgi:hypothetical protein
MKSKYQKTKSCLESGIYGLGWEVDYMQQTSGMEMTRKMTENYKK